MFFLHFLQRGTTFERPVFFSVRKYIFFQKEYTIKGKNLLLIRMDPDLGGGNQKWQQKSCFP